MKYNKYSKYHHIIEDDIFENKVIREVDEDKEEEESGYTASNKKGMITTFILIMIKITILKILNQLDKV